MNHLFDIHTHHESSEAIINLPDSVLEDSSRLPSAFSDLLWSVGIHPMFQGDWDKAWQNIQKIASSPHIAAIGECGLDKRSIKTLEEQKTFFLQQMNLADQLHLPLIIHCVHAWNDLLRIHQDHPSIYPRIIHAFRGKPEQAAQLLKAGFLLSFGPHFNPESLRLTPPEKRFFETDDSGNSIEEVARLQSLS